MIDPTKQTHLLTERGWDVGWEGHETAQLKRMAALPLAGKIRWLEEAQRTVKFLAQTRERKWQEADRPSQDPSVPAPTPQSL